MPRLKTASLILLGSLLFYGCDQPQTTKQQDGDSSMSEDHNHDHAADANRHSIAGHTHGVGPHGGTIADWGGGKFHVEFTVDHDEKEATAYVLGTDEKTPKTINSEVITLAIKNPAFSTELKPVPLDSELLGGCSRFVGSHENLGIVKEYAGSMSAVVDGTPYSGNFEEKP
jgi:Txe/YoeB family toxin of Txe-Axe toxin-antitoxin module